MGFYLRKSVSVGPLRFNLSKSGIGVSAGVKGLRFGVGPRGNYVHMGRAGIYYRATLPGNSGASRELRRQPTRVPEHSSAPRIEMEAIESGDVAEMVDSSSVALLQELDEKQKQSKISAPVAIVFGIVVAFGLAISWPFWIVATLGILGCCAVYAAWGRDELNKSVVLFYDFDQETERLYEELHSSAAEVAACAGTWHISAKGDVHDRKYFAGATAVVERKRTFVRRESPPFLKTNIDVVAIGVGKQTLYLFPERILVYDASGVGAVSYRDLRVSVREQRFVESDDVPSDANVVDSTWRYVNKRGGPDRRFKDNRELPICQYEEIALSSHTGLNEILQISKQGPGELLAQAFVNLTKRLPREIV